jgi:Methyltransferase domain.
MADLRILNVGCGMDTYGTDFVDRSPMRKGVIRCDFDIDPLPYKTGTFDEVYLKGVMEHVRNNLNLISECNRVLKKGGKIVVITANAGLWGFWGSAAHGKYEKDSFEHSRMYALFTPNQIRNWLEEAGFRKIDLAYIDDKHDAITVRSVGITILSKLNKRLKPRIMAVGKK